MDFSTWQLVKKYFELFVSCYMKSIICLFCVFNLLLSNNSQSLCFAGDKGIGVVKSYNRVSNVSRYAVIVGISRYHNPVLNLQYAAKDALAFYNFLLSPIGGSFHPENVKLLLNENATAPNLRSALGTFLARAHKDDLIIIYFSGHGSPTPVNKNDLYLLTYEADLNDLARTAFPMDEIKRYLEKSIIAKRVVIIADSCYSGGIQLMGVGVHAASKSLSRYLSGLSRSRYGLASITASRIFGSAIEDKKYGSGHGIFTYYLLKGLTADSFIADTNHNGLVDLAEAYHYVRKRVKEETKGKQIPEASGDLNVGIPLAVVSKTNLPEIDEKINILFGMFREIGGKIIEKVNPGATLSSGDSYFFYIRADQPCYLYLFQKDSSGAVYRLFPNTTFHTPPNPVLGGQVILLPNSKEVFYLDNVVGKEEILLFASKKKIDKLENFSTGMYNELEFNDFPLMGVAGLKKRKAIFMHSQKNVERIVDEMIMSGNLVYRFNFFHK